VRILLKPVVDFPAENLILAESTQFRSSQLTRSGGTLAASDAELTTIYKLHIFYTQILDLYS